MIELRESLEGVALGLVELGGVDMAGERGDRVENDAQLFAVTGLVLQNIGLDFRLARFPEVDIDQAELAANGLIHQVIGLIVWLTSPDRGNLKTDISFSRQ